MHVFFISEWFPTPRLPYNGIFILEHARAVALQNTVSFMHILGIDPSSGSAIKITPRPDITEIDVYQLSYHRPKLRYTAWIRQISGAYHVFKKVTDSHGRPDIINANIGNTADVAVILGKYAGIPVVVSEHSSAYARNLLSPSQARWVRFFMNRVDLIMPDCDYLGQKISVFGINRPMISVSNIATTVFFSPAAPGEQIISPYREIAMVARLSEEKAVHLAIQATARLQERGIYYHLQIVGDGPERSRLEALVAEFGLANWVHFHGNLSKSEVARILKRASIFMLTSLWDNQPVVILEALTCGLPVLAPAVGGIPEIITPACGMLFLRDNLDDLCEKLCAMHENLAAFHSEAIHSYAVSHFSPEVVGGKLDSIYRRLIEDRQAYKHVEAN